MARTIRDMLDQARDFHRQLAAFYETLGHGATGERVRLLLDYMSRHEGHLERCIEEYESEAGDDILASRILYEPGTATCRCFENVTLAPDMAITDVIAVALKLDECLVRFYLQIAENATHPDVRDLFMHLRDLELAEERMTVRNALETDDL